MVEFGVVCRRIGPHQRQANPHSRTLGKLGRLFEDGEAATPGRRRVDDHPPPTWHRSMLQVLPRQVCSCPRGWNCPSPPLSWSDPEPNQPKVCWQRQAVKQVEQPFIQNEVWPTLDDSARALMRSQNGPLASAPFTVLPTSRVMRTEAQSFRFLLCRRLRFPIHLSCVLSDVAANSTLLATIAQRAKWQGSWGDEGSLWNVRLHRSVAKQGLGIAVGAMFACSAARAFACHFSTVPPRQGLVT